MFWLRFPDNTFGRQWPMYRHVSMHDRSPESSVSPNRQSRFPIGFRTLGFRLKSFLDWNPFCWRDRLRLHLLLHGRSTVNSIRPCDSVLPVDFVSQFIVLRHAEPDIGLLDGDFHSSTTQIHRTARSSTKPS